MKDILITTSIGVERHRAICKSILEDTKTVGPEAKQILETSWLLSGPQSFSKSMLILDKLKENELPVAVFEIESVLVAPTQDQD